MKEREKKKSLVRDFFGSSRTLTFVSRCVFLFVIHNKWGAASWTRISEEKKKHPPSTNYYHFGWFTFGSSGFFPLWGISKQETLPETFNDCENPCNSTSTHVPHAWPGFVLRKKMKCFNGQNLVFFQRWNCLTEDRQGLFCCNMEIFRKLSLPRYLIYSLRGTPDRRSLWYARLF